MTKEAITKKLKEVEGQTELLNLSKHRALWDYIIVVPAEIRESGVTTRATQFEDRPEIGIVVSVGDLAESRVSVGDVVFFGKYSHVKVTHDDMTYLIMRAEDVYCVS